MSSVFAIADAMSATPGVHPQMGWNTWNIFHCNISESIVQQNADKLVELGLKDLGYNYLVIDDCWQASERDANGYIQPDMTKFSNGMKSVGDYLHSKGLWFGIYSSAGIKTCQGLPGGLNYEMKDAMNYSSWGVDYLKYDNCYNQGVPAIERYTAMGDALKATGRSIFYSLCNWGNEQVSKWGKTIANSWRTT